AGIAFYRLARAEAGAGRYVQAFRHLARAERAADGGQRPGPSLAVLARSGRADLLADLRREVGFRGEPSGSRPSAGRDSAAGLLAELTGNQVPVGWGLPALLALGDLWRRAGR